MLLRLLRYLRGYARFSVSGTYPERFINITLRNRLRLWDVDRSGGGMTACMYLRDYLRVRQFARKSGVRLRVCERRGLPFLLRRYSDRAGLLIGAAVFVITIFVMSLFIWSIDVTGLETISESEMRSLLAENGVYVGAFRPAADVPNACRNIMLADDRVGWMAINVTASYASVEIKEESPSPEVEDLSEPCNIKARRDGRILSINAEQGVTSLEEGSGVAAGQVIVSGVMEDKQGGVRLVHAKAEVLAQTEHHTSFHIPETVGIYTPTGEVKRRLSADLFGLSVPLTVGGVSTAQAVTDETVQAPAPLDVRLPTGLITRDIYALEKQKKRLNYNSAKELLIKEAQLYEVFKLSDCKVTDRTYHVKKADGGYTLTADYTCIEDIAVQEKIGVDF